MLAPLIIEEQARVVESGTTAPGSVPVDGGESLAALLLEAPV